MKNSRYRFIAEIEAPGEKGHVTRHYAAGDTPAIYVGMGDDDGLLIRGRDGDARFLMVYRVCEGVTETIADVRETIGKVDDGYWTTVSLYMMDGGVLVRHSRSRDGKKHLIERRGAGGWALADRVEFSDAEEAERLFKMFVRQTIDAHP